MRIAYGNGYLATTYTDLHGLQVYAPTAATSADAAAVGANNCRNQGALFNSLGPPSALCFTMRA